MKNKETNLHPKRKMYTVDNKMYGIFSIIILFVIVLAIVMLRYYSFNFSCALSTDIVGLVSGVLSGLLASVIVAWLLDHGTCKRKNEILEKAVSTDLDYLKMWIDALFQSMRDSLLAPDQQKGLVFEKLYPIFVEQYNVGKDYKALDKDLLGIYVNINMIITTLDKLLTGEEKEYLLIMYGDLYPFLILKKSIIDFRENLFNNGSLSYDFIFTGIFDYLATAIKYVDLLSKEYKATQVHRKENEVILQ